MIRRTPAAPVAAALATLAAVGAGLATARPLPSAKKCRIFPRSSHWNQRVDKLPLLSNSNAMVAAVGASRSSHADFGSGLYNGGPIGIPYTTVKKTQKRVPVSFQYADESDRGPYPIPRNAPIEGGRSSDGDRHVIVVDRSRCRLFELFDAHPQGGGSSWHAGSGAIWNLRSNHLRPAAAGPPPTPPGCPSCPGWPATTRCAAAGSTTRSASRCRARGAPSSTRPATRPRA